MSTVRLVLIVFLSFILLGCTSGEREILAAEKKIELLKSEIQELRAKNAALTEYEEMAIGEVAFAQGCRLWINTCFGLDQVGGQLIQRGLSAQGSVHHFLWMASKIIFFCLMLTTIAASSIVLMNRIIAPSFDRQKAALDTLKKAFQAEAQFQNAKVYWFAELESLKADVDSQMEANDLRLRDVINDIELHEAECERLQGLILRYQGELKALELAKIAAEAFSQISRKKN